MLTTQMKTFNNFMHVDLVFYAAEEAAAKV